MKITVKRVILSIASAGLLFINGCGGGGGDGNTVDVSTPLPKVAALKGGIIYSSDPTSNIYLVATDDNGNVQITYKTSADGKNSYSLVSTTGEVFTVVNTTTGNVTSIDLNGEYKVTAKTFDSNGKPVTYEVTGAGITPLSFAASALAPQPKVPASVRPAMSFSISTACPSDELSDESLDTGEYILAYVCNVAASVPDSQAINRLLDLATNAGASFFNRFENLGQNLRKTGEKVASHLSQVVKKNNEIMDDSLRTSSEKLMILKLETGFIIGAKLPSIIESNRDAVLGLANATRGLNTVNREDHLTKDFHWNSVTDNFDYKSPPVPVTPSLKCTYPSVLQAGVCYSNCIRPASGGLVCDTPKAPSCTAPQVLNSARTACILPTPTPVPVVTFTATPSTVASGETTTLSWTSTNSTSCSSTSGGGSGTTGSFTTPALTVSTTYSVTCTGSGGTTSQKATVTVAATGPVVTSISPITATLNQLTTFTVTGSNLIDGMRFTLEGCSGNEVIGVGTNTMRQFTCNSALSGINNGEIKDRVDGLIVKAFTVSISSKNSSCTNISANYPHVKYCYYLNSAGKQIYDGLYEEYVLPSGGQLVKQVNYKDGILNGPATYYDREFLDTAFKGTYFLGSEGNYTQGEQSGLWKYYWTSSYNAGVNSLGKLSGEVTYGKLFNGYTVAAESKDYCPYGPGRPGSNEFPPAKAGKLFRISRINLATGEHYPDQLFFKNGCDIPD